MNNREIEDSFGDQNNSHEHLAQLLTLSQTLNSSLKMEEVLNMAMDMVVDFVKAERGFIMLYTSEGELELKAQKNVDMEHIMQFKNFSRTILNASAREGQNVLSVDAQTDPRFKNLDSVMLSGMRSVMCVPLRVKSKIIGVVYLDNRIEIGMFKERHLHMLSAFANQAAIALENARLYENLIKSYNERIKLTQELHQQEKIRLASEEANKAKSEFVYIVSHELRSPLTVIKNYTSMLYRDASLDRHAISMDDKMKIYQTVDQEVDRLISMINKLLNVSRIDAGKGLALDLKKCDIPKLISNVLKMQRTSKFYKDIHKIVVKIPSDLPDFKCDPEMLAQVLYNLVENALKYSPDGGDVIIDVSHTDEYMKFSVKDNGLGVSTKNIDRLFKKYERFDDKSRRAIPGTGLGLYLINHLIELHHGKVSVESELGAGSEFIFTIPLKLPVEDQKESVVT